MKHAKKVDPVEKWAIRICMAVMIPVPFILGWMMVGVMDMPLSTFLLIMLGCMVFSHVLVYGRRSFDFIFRRYHGKRVKRR